MDCAGVSVTEIYMKLVEAEAALLRKSDECTKLDGYLNHILQEIEAKTPLLDVRTWLLVHIFLDWSLENLFALLV